MKSGVPCLRAPGSAPRIDRGCPREITSRRAAAEHGAAVRAYARGRRARFQSSSRRGGLQPRRGRPEQFGKEFLDLAAPQLPLQYRLLVLVNPVNLKDMFGRVQTNSDNRFGQRS